MGMWQKIKRLLCRHRYADINLSSCTLGNRIIFSNRCIKCGKVSSWELDKKCMDNILEQDMRRLLRK